MDTQETTFVGLDVHKSSIFVALLLPRSGKPVEWQLSNDSPSVGGLCRQLKKKAQGQLLVCYEAGPCGYVLQRQLQAQGIACQVIAPSLIPYKPGDKIKTDRRDARKLAECLRAGMLREVAPPDEQEESVRDLVRCREDAKEDLMRARQRLSKFLLRRGFAYGGNAWSRAWRRWVNALKLVHSAEQDVLGDYLLALDQVESRLKGLDEKMKTVSQEEPYRDKVGALRCFRGIETLTAMTLLVEIRQFFRFDSPRQLMAYLGLVPSEYSSGGRSFRGSITKTGNRHARRVLVECAHQYRHRPIVGPALKKRRQGQSPQAIAQADKAQVRLHHRFNYLSQKRQLPYNKAVTAVARELCGFLWAALYPLETKAAA